MRRGGAPVVPQEAAPESVAQSRRRRRRVPVLYDVSGWPEHLFEPGLPSALAALSRRERVVVVVVHGFGFTLHEVAELTGLRRATVQNHSDRGLAQLRKIERSFAAGSAAPRKTGRRRAAIGGVTAGIAVAGCAAALLIAPAHPGAPVHPSAPVHPGRPSPASPATLTAAMVQHLAAASQSALATSGREQITFQNRKNGTVDGYGNDVITFSGSNYNWAMDDLIPPSPSLHVSATKASTIIRVVNGVAYIQPDLTAPKSPWLRATKWRPTAYFPVPRTALQLLSPRASFQDVGWQVISGVRLEHLRATQVRGLPGNLTFAGYRQPGESLSALDLWVDASGVVHRMQLELKSSDSATTMTVAFSEFGQPETITAPAHWIRSGI